MGILRIVTCIRSGKRSSVATRMIAYLGGGLILVFCFLGTACQSEYKTVLDPLGPVPGSSGVHFEPRVVTSIVSAPPGQGSLLVVTPTGLAYAGSTMYFPHLSYLILSENGWPVRCVTNHRDRTDEEPTEIHLPAGRYTLVAEADSLGKVKIPLEISSGTRTKVVLQRFRGQNDVW